MPLKNDGGSIKGLQGLLDRLMSEEEWQLEVMSYATAHSWMVAHFRPARVGERWITAMQGHPGLPDLVFGRNGIVVLAELKRWGKKPTEAQQGWLDAVGGYCWTPEHRQEMQRVLE